ncbi:MAG: large extracellular alpha-helical protein [Microbacterium sp.]|uniref:DUF5719 family protein n=1 Tax=Microbacterium sp. TaxID=51671 RepID=UPI000DB7F0FB|nr:DUF5719 family protein [Microbacterium sp.]PZU40884.1 MAG: large extracellular alpha-helical protein [Microbacterium sp.]
MTERRTLRTILTSARVLIGAAVAVVLVAAVAVAVAAPLPTFARSAVSIVETPTPSETVAVCAGPLLATGRTSGAASEITVAADADLRYGSAEGEPAQEGLRAASVDDSSGPSVLRMSPIDREAASLAGAQASTATAEDLIGFAASACEAPRFESWLAAGATSTGASDLVVLSNPGDVAATVQIGVYGQAGLTTPPGGDDVIVPARAQIVLSLAGLALGEFTPVLRVQASGAPVTAHLQASRTVTLEPVGVDVTGATVAPATRQVIAGIVTPSAADPAIEGSSTVRVRVLAPSAAARATVTVTAQGSSSPAVAPAELDLAEGVPLDIDLAGLPAGSYTVDVETEGVPVIASAWTSSALGGERDFAWIAAAPMLEQPALLAVAEAPAGAATAVHVVAGSEAAEVVLTPVNGGEARTLSLTADEAGAVAVPAGSWRIEATAPVHAAVSYASPTAVAGYPVQPGQGAAAAVRVVP